MDNGAWLVSLVVLLVVVNWLAVRLDRWATASGRTAYGQQLRKQILGSYTPHVSLMSENVLLAGTPSRDVTIARAAFRCLLREGYFAPSEEPVFLDGTLAYYRTDKQHP